MWKWALASMAAGLCAACGGTTAAESAADVASDVADGELSDASTAADADATTLADASTDVVAPDIQAFCLEGLPNPLQFAPTKYGTAAMSTLTLHNCGLQGICLTGIELQNQSANLGEYNVTLQGLATLCPGVDSKTGPSVTAPCCLAAGAQVTVEVYFTPKTASAEAKTAQIWVHYNATKTIVTLTGMATP